jgi:hypothetical protein
MNAWSNVAEIVPGYTYIFLSNMDSRRVVGAFDAVRPPAIDIVKEAWGPGRHGHGRFPAQVAVTRVSAPDAHISSRVFQRIRDGYRASTFGRIGARMVSLQRGCVFLGWRYHARSGCVTAVGCARCRPPPCWLSLLLHPPRGARLQQLLVALHLVSSMLPGPSQVVAKKVSCRQSPAARRQRSSSMRVQLMIRRDLRKRWLRRRFCRKQLHRLRSWQKWGRQAMPRQVPRSRQCAACRRNRQRQQQRPLL